MRRDLSRLSPLSSYSYTIHTVSPPRPLIPVSRGGVQTGKQTGGWVASLFMGCLTRWAWQSISHLQNFSNGISMRLRNSGLYLQVEILIHTMEMHEFKDAERGIYWISCLTLQMPWNRFSTGAVLQIQTVHPHFHSLISYFYCIYTFQIRHSKNKTFVRLNFNKTAEWAGPQCLQTHLQNPLLAICIKVPSCEVALWIGATAAPLWPHMRVNLLSTSSPDVYKQIQKEFM